MLQRFYPNRYVASVYDVDFEKEYQRGIRGIIFDIDNTLVPHDATVSDDVIRLFEDLRTIGMKTCLISNNDEERVKPFAQKISALYLHKANKPSKKNYVKAVELMGTTKETTLFLGDQIFTDICGAKTAEIPAILVKPVDPTKEPFQICLKRKLERIILRHYHIFLRKKNIVLVGFMGSGKTTVGKILSKKTGYTLVDTDELVEKKVGMKISQIFELRGEEYFRTAETEVLKTLLGKKHIILSTGGGLPMREENRALLRKIGYTVFLNVTRETVEQRLEGDSSRPLLRGGDIGQRFDDMMSQRGPIYDVTADISLSTDDKTVDKIADEILACRGEDQLF